MQIIYRKNRNLYKVDDSLKIIYSIIDYANEPESKVFEINKFILECLCMDCRWIWWIYT